MEHYTYKHSLGELTGILRAPDVVQFRGIPYARIPSRFRQSIIADSFGAVKYDATKPECPQVLVRYPAFWEGLAPPDVPNLPSPPPDEFKCLNLSITVPKSALEVKLSESLPVLLFIHGGGFVGGSQIVKVAGREIYDPTNLVRASIGFGKPIVVVTINYRVGILGFAACKELQEFNAANKEPFSNYGLHDQRRALEWVGRYIREFGGDPNNVTIYGNSAGGASCHYQIFSKEKMFQRAIISSGTLFGIGPLPLESQQSKFESIAERLKYLPGNGSIVEFVQSKPVEELLCAALPSNSGGAIHPTIDHDWITGCTLDAMSSILNPPEIILGACAFEQELTDMIIGGRDPVDKRSIEDKIRAAKEFLTPNGLLKESASFPTPAILAAYKIDTNPTTPENSKRSHDAVAEMLADVAFRVPAVYTALKYPGSAFLYDFQATNPFPGVPKSFRKANHGINDLYVFNVAVDQIPTQSLADWNTAARQVQDMWVRFCYGEKPWGPFDPARKGPVFTFADGAKGGEQECVGSAVGEATWQKWQAILDLAM